MKRRAVYRSPVIPAGDPSPRAREGLRNFWSELYRLDAVERVSRDKDRLPKVSQRAIGRVR